MDIAGTLVDLLFTISGKNSLVYTYADLARAVLALCIGVYLAHRPTTTRTTRSWQVFTLVGLGLLGWDILHGNLLILTVTTALNVLVFGLVGVVAYKLRLISDPALKLLIALGLLFPMHPLLTVFPLQESAFSLVFLKLFAIPFFTNLTLVILGYVLYCAVRHPPHQTADPFAEAFGERVPVSRVHTHSGRLLMEEGDHTLFGLSGDDIADYLDWRATTEKVADATTLHDIDAPQLDAYFEAREYDVDAETLESLTARFDWLANEEEVWMTNPPAFERFVVLTLVLSLVIGNLLLFLVP